MKIKDVLQRDPSNPLVNQGQARIADRTNEKVIQELKGELSSFVCEGQYADGIQRIIESFLANASQTSQKGAWVSGFFGSGKSHFLKMLAHLWQNTPLDGTTARALVPSMPTELATLLKELDTAGKRGGGLLAAAGALPSGTTDSVRLTILGVLLRAVGLPAQFAQARFCLWLRDEGYYDTVRTTVEQAGKEFSSELNNLYVSKPIVQALLSCDSKFARDEADARKTLREQFVQPTDIDTAHFLSTFKSALTLVSRDGRMPLTALVLDEVQQYIGSSQERSTLVSEVAEAVSKQLDSNVIIIGAGQSALTDVPLLQRLMDRFTIRVSLSDTDVETVTRKVLLDKKPATVKAVRDLLDTHSGEISRQLQGTSIGEFGEDRDLLPRDYPLLPVRRRFWEYCFRQVDAAGTQSQLRSQLRIIHDAVANVADRPLGAVIPADDLYEALAPEMVNTGVLLREINERIIKLDDGTSEGKLARRICGLVFLIGKLSRDPGADIGVRATKEHIADLLVDDLTADNGKLRSAVEGSLQKLEANGVLMRVGEEYRLQTKEGSEWDREFRIRQSKLSSDEADVQIRRDALLYAEADSIVRSLKILQGAAKVPRPLQIHREQTPPAVNGDGSPVWIRDGWSASEKAFVDDARAAGADSPIIFVFIPRQSHEDLRKLVIDADASQQTLDYKGVPTTPEGNEAQQSMKSRHDLAVQQRDALIRQVVANAKVYQGGGSEVLQLTLDNKLRDAVNASLVRMFPRFKEADALGTAWEAVIKKSKAGLDLPFQHVGHNAPAEQHAVCKEVLSTIGSGKTGAEIRKLLKASPYGWPDDAIDAALIELHRLQQITVTLNGAALAPGQLDQNKISKAEFRIEKTTISMAERLKLVGLFNSLKVPAKTNNLAENAPLFLQALLALARSAGGAPPLPATPTTTDIEDIQKLVGNDQLAAILKKAGDFQSSIEKWTKIKELSEKRNPVWAIVERLATHANRVPAAADQLKQVEAIRSGRMLLDVSDPATAVRSQLSDVLRTALKQSQAALEQAYTAGLANLSASSTWQKLKDIDRERILADVGLVAPEKLDVATDDALLATLDRRNLSARRSEVDAVAGRVQRALEQAAKLLQPKVRRITLETATLTSKQEVRAWVERQQKRLEEEIAAGPVLVG